MRLPNYIAVTIAGTMVNSLIDTDSVSSSFSYIATSTLDVSRSDIGDVVVFVGENMEQMKHTPAITLLASETKTVSFC